MKIRRNMMKRAALVVAPAVLLFAGWAMVDSPASAQGYGSGLYHHSELGYRGAAGHFDYGDLHANQVQMRHGVYPSTRYSTGYRGTVAPITYSSPIANSNQTTYTGSVNTQGHPTGDLYPGMVLPDGAVVVSVGQ